MFYLTLFQICSHFCVSTIRGCLTSLKWVALVCIIRLYLEYLKYCKILSYDGCKFAYRPRVRVPSMKVNSCGLLKHKNGYNSETRSDRTYVHINFFHCSCDVSYPLLKWAPHVTIQLLYSTLHLRSHFSNYL